MDMVIDLTISVCTDCHNWLRSGDATYFDSAYSGEKADERFAEVADSESRLIRHVGAERFACIRTRRVFDDVEMTQVCDCCGHRETGVFALHDVYTYADAA